MRSGLASVTPSTSAVRAEEAEHVDQPTRFRYRPALDGLRAVALIGVMLYHGTLMTTSPVWVAAGGFFTVDLFFVLSGFLITTLLLYEWRAEGGIDLKRFYVRRVRRLVPALVMVLAGVSLLFLLVGSKVFSGTQTANFRGDSLSSIFYGTNWRFALSSESYFDKLGGPSPLRHLWTLAIEEQFYLTWPLLLYVLLRYLRVSWRALGIGLAVAAAGSATLMAVLHLNGASDARVYYGTDTRAQAMLLGALLAVILLNVRSTVLDDWRVQLVGWVCLGGLLVMFSQSLDTDPWIYTGGFTLASVLAVGAILAAAAPGVNPYTRVLSLRPLVWFGQLSYGIYLWHWPVFVLLSTERTGLGGITLLALRFAVTTAVATASYYLVEAPIRFRRVHKVVPVRVFSAAAALTVLVIVAGLVAVTPAPGELVIDEPTDILDVLDPIEVKPGDVKVSLFGDSAAVSLYTYRDKSVGGVAVHSAAIVGCGIARGELVPLGATSGPTREHCQRWPETWRNEIARFQPDFALVLAAGWEVYDHRVDGRLLRVGTEEYATYLASELDLARTIISDGGSHMVLLTSPCFKTLRPGSETDSAERNDVSRVDWVNSVYQRWADEHDDVTLVDLHGYQCPTGQYQEHLEGVKLSDDGTHYTKDSAPLIWRWLRAQLEPLARK